MTRPMLFATAIALALSACATGADRAPTATADAMPTRRDAYVRMAAAADRFEIQTSEVALKRAGNPAVRQFARMMIDHHDRTTRQLWSAAHSFGMIRTHEWMLPPAEQRVVEALESVPSADFDRAYLRQQIIAHERALALHGNYARKGDARALRAAAAAAVPIIRRHLARARQLD